MYTRIFLSVESHLMAQHLRTTIAIEQIDKSSHANHEARRHTHTHTPGLANIHGHTILSSHTDNWVMICHDMFVIVCIYRHAWSPLDPTNQAWHMVPRVPVKDSGATRNCKGPTWANRHPGRIRMTKVDMSWTCPVFSDQANAILESTGYKAVRKY